MSQTSVTLIAAIIAAVASVGNVVLGYVVANWREHARWELARSDELDQRHRQALDDFAAVAARAVWEANWLTWKAAHDPTSVDVYDINEYNISMRETLPRLLTTRVRIIAFDRGNFNSASDIAKHIYCLDVNIALAARTIEENTDNAVAKLAALYSAALAFHDQLPNMLAAELSRVGQPALRESDLGPASMPEILKDLCHQLPR